MCDQYYACPTEKISQTIRNEKKYFSPPPFNQTSGKQPTEIPGNDLREEDNGSPMPMPATNNNSMDLSTDTPQIFTNFHQLTPNFTNFVKLHLILPNFAKF